MERRRIGIGTLSLPLAVIGFLWALTIKGFCLGDVVLRFLGILAWSNGDSGTHYTVFWSLLFFIPAFILGIKFKGNWGAKTGRVLSIIFLVFTLLSMFFISAR